MGLRVAIQMDPVATIDIRGDSSFALGLAAQGRGHEL
ncbi:MAG: glutathione synthase, partial [Alphaproteobacteria bacterium]